MLRLTDLVVVLLCFSIVCAFFRNRSFADYYGFFSTFYPFIPLFVISFIIAGLYPGLSLAPAGELRRFTVGSLLASILCLAFTTGLKFRVDQNSEVFLFVWLISIPLLTVCRVVSRALISRSTLWGVPTVVFGTGRETRALVDRLLRCRWIGYKPELILEEDGKKGAAYRGIPVIRDIPRGFNLAKSFGYSTVLVSLPASSHEKYKNIVRNYVTRFPTFIMFSDYIGLVGVWSQVRDFEGMIGLSKKQKLLIPQNMGVKRVMDLLVVFIGSVVILPFTFLIALLVKLDSPGPVFYRQRRLGKGGHEITTLKFRSMITGAENKLSECLKNDTNAMKEWNSNHKLKADPRITRVGLFLRKSSLDELPQFLNVLKGEMSIVGPRPIVRQEVRHYRNAWESVSSVLPGITGLWQVSGRSETGYHERVEQDLYYIQNWSIWLDLFILFKTVWIVLSGKGAY
ncbi:MAG: undecaprenyl-phosphate galactose phosphotransferase WbaP [Deltaproteobacteria bacterium]|nr:undecaprenyl-phosphate galactose phosphotransferase WbaP [Deltaproteobacteria bacterium]